MHRLVWMLANRRVVPRGTIVHHRFGKEREQPEDLELMLKRDHEEWHADYGDEHDEGDEAALREFLTGVPF